MDAKRNLKKTAQSGVKPLQDATSKMGNQTKRRLSAADFDRATPYLRISKDRIDAARKVMVQGLPSVAVADEFGWTRNAVSICVKKVWDAFQLSKELEASHADVRVENVGSTEILPAGWLRVTITAPKELVDRWQTELSDYAGKSKG